MAHINLIFIPMPTITHLTPTLKIANTLLTRDPHLSITFLIIQIPNQQPSLTSLITSTTSHRRLQFINVPNEHPQSSLTSPIIKIIQSSQPAVKKITSKLIESNAESGIRVAGFVLDMFCTDMLHVSTDFDLPSYICYTSGSSFLALLFHVQKLCDDEGMEVAEFKDSSVELCLPGFLNSVPAKLLPSFAFMKERGFSDAFVNKARQFRKTKGVLVNSFVELECHAVESMKLDKSIPTVYSVGPVVDLSSKSAGDQEKEAENDVMGWLDRHPPASVVFLCFGSRGAFQQVQVKEIAHGLESSGCRFLWALRRPSSNQEMLTPPEDYEDFSEVLPDGFLERTAETGKVIGWAPQTAVLEHPSVGGFVSHCGWNSILESLWFGVPIATWPLYAEQQINAFEAVKEMKIAVEISLDYRIENGEVISGEQIERGIRQLLQADSEVRKNVEFMMEKSREAVVKGGSSYNNVLQFLDDVRSNIGM